MVSAICQTCRMLSSDTLATTQWSLRFQLKSDTLAVWPPCTNSSSGGPSSASSGLCSWPMRLTSHTCRRRSRPQDPRMDSLKGAQPTWYTPFLWPWKLCMRCDMLRRSHKATAWSEPPVASRNSLKGLNATQLMSFSCAAATFFTGLASRLSHTRSCESSPTEAKMWSCCRLQSTSSTTLPWPRKVARACTSTEAWFTSHRHTSESSEPLSR
mmetsp:Transcript_28573/g.39319  ORF Transcript_28573/g.39319 Transcript_28573/m.39319 type:complete len:212 (+) Transcript_28573:112-747(+)